MPLPYHSGWYLISVAKWSAHPEAKTNNRVLRSLASNVIVCDLNRVQDFHWKAKRKEISYLYSLLSIQYMLQSWSFWTCIALCFRHFVPKRNEVLCLFNTYQKRFIFETKNIVVLYLIFKMKCLKTSLFVTFKSWFHTLNAKFSWMRSSSNDLRADCVEPPSADAVNWCDFTS